MSANTSQNNEASQTTVDLRGIVLPGHRAFRKAIGSYAGEQKGLNVEAGMNLRDNPASMVAFQAMHMHMQAMFELRKIEKEFGLPAGVPAEDFTLYLQHKRRALDNGYTEALQGMAREAISLMGEEPRTEAYRKQAMVAAQAAGKVDAYSYALLTFHRTFDDVMAKIAELEGF